MFRTGAQLQPTPTCWQVGFMCCLIIFRARSGLLRLVGSGRSRVTAAVRSAALPDIPTLAETVPGYEASVFYGVSEPKGTPPAVIEILNKAFTAALSDPNIQKRIAELGGVPMPMTPNEFGKLLTDETEKWAQVVRSAGISVE